MGGDGTAEIINEYLSRQGGFIALVVALLVISVAMIIFGIVMSIIKAHGSKKQALATSSVAESTAKETPLAKKKGGKK